MTNQMPDSVVFKETEYIIYDCEYGKLIYDYFDENYKIDDSVNFEMCSTALRRGHQECYKVVNDELFGHKYTINDIYDYPKPNPKDYRYEKVPYTGGIIIGNPTFCSSLLIGYLFAEKAYELHFTEGILDEVCDLKEAIQFRKKYEESEYYKKSESQRDLNGKYLNAIAVHFLKYAYDPFRNMYWRIPGNNLGVSYTDEELNEIRSKYESDFEELLTKI